MELFKPLPSGLTVSPAKRWIASPFDFAGVQQSFYDRVNRGKEIFLGWQTQSLNPTPNLCWIEGFLCRSENCSYRVSNSFHQTANCRSVLVRFCQFMQGSHLFFLFCYLGLKVYAGANQALQFNKRLGKIGLVFICHSSI